MAEYKVSGSDLTNVADAIRTKGGTSASLSFPDGFVSGIGAIPTGGGSTLITKSITANGTYDAQDDDADGYSEVTVNVAGLKHESGSFTTPSSGSSYTLNFQNTYSKYVLFIEASDESKATIVSSGETSAKTFAALVIYPKLHINSSDAPNQTSLFRIKPSTGAIDDGFPTSGFTYTGGSATMPLGLITSGANYLYRGMTYSYYIAEIV